jgi:hypothetical protein
VDITPPLERVHQGGSNIVAKGRTTTLNKYWMIKVKKHEPKKRKKISKLGEPPKHGLIFQIRNPWNLRLGLSQEAQFPTNLMLKDEMKKKSFKKLAK